MRTRSRISRICSATATAALLLAAACESPAGLEPGAGPSLSKGVATDPLKAARQATARFHSTTQAIKAGYVADAHCVAVPGLGGMGFHWVNAALVDPVFDPTQPEAILYAPGPNGKSKLVALEYIVVDVGQPRPSLAGQPFDVGGVPPLEAAGVPHWSLHVWLYEDNPSGMFAPFNPNVSCG